MTQDERIDRLTEQVGNLRLRCRLLFLFCLATLLVLLALMRFGYVLRWNASVRHLEVDELYARRINLVDHGGKELMYFFAYPWSTRGGKDAINVDFGSDSVKSRLTLRLDEGKSHVIRSGVANNKMEKQEVGQWSPYED